MIKRCGWDESFTLYTPWLCGCALGGVGAGGVEQAEIQH
jgi:hypothetical protein